MFPEFLQMTKFVHCYHNFKPGHAGLPVGSIHMKSNWANWSVCWFAVLEFMAFPILVGCTPMIEMFFFSAPSILKGRKLWRPSPQDNQYLAPLAITRIDERLRSGLMWNAWEEVMDITGEIWNQGVPPKWQYHIYIYILKLARKRWLISRQTQIWILVW